MAVGCEKIRFTMGESHSEVTIRPLEVSTGHWQHVHTLSDFFSTVAHSNNVNPNLSVSSCDLC